MSKRTSLPKLTSFWGVLGDLCRKQVGFWFVVPNNCSGLLKSQRRFSRFVRSIKKTFPKKLFWVGLKNYLGGWFSITSSLEGCSALRPYMALKVPVKGPLAPPKGPWTLSPHNRWIVQHSGVEMKHAILNDQLQRIMPIITLIVLRPTKSKQHKLTNCTDN